MVSCDTVRKIALAIEGSIELPHFEKTSFRIKKKIFLTMDESKSTAVVKLSLIDQDVFTKISKGSIVTLSNKWGQQGWTEINLKKVSKKLFLDAMHTSINEMIRKK